MKAFFFNSIGWSFAAALFTGLAALTGFWALWLRTRDAKLSADRLARYQTHSAIEIANAQSRAQEAGAIAARAYQDAAEANERAATLEKETEVAKLELARIDPINRPIGSVQVELSVTVHGPVDEKMVSFESPLLSNIPSLGFMNGEEPLIFLTRTRLTHHRVVYNDDSESVAHQFYMSFSWPRGDIVSFLNGNNSEVRDWFEKESVTTADFDKAVTALGYSLLGVGDEVALSGGSCVVTINGSIVRRFKVPSKTKAGGYILMISQELN